MSILEEIPGHSLDAPGTPSGLMGEAAFASTVSETSDGNPTSGGITADEAKLLGEAGKQLITVIGGVITGNTGKLTPEQLAAVQREAERQKRAKERARTMAFVVVLAAVAAFVYLRKRR